MATIAVYVAALISWYLHIVCFAKSMFHLCDYLQMQRGFKFKSIALVGNTLVLLIHDNHIYEIPLNTHFHAKSKQIFMFHPNNSSLIKPTQWYKSSYVAEALANRHPDETFLKNKVLQSWNMVRLSANSTYIHLWLKDSHNTAGQVDYSWFVDIREPNKSLFIKNHQNLLRYSSVISSANNDQVGFLVYKQECYSSCLNEPKSRLILRPLTIANNDSGHWLNISTFNTKNELLRLEDYFHLKTNSKRNKVYLTHRNISKLTDVSMDLLYKLPFGFIHHGTVYLFSGGRIHQRMYSFRLADHMHSHSLLTKPLVFALESKSWSDVFMCPQTPSLVKALGKRKYKNNNAQFVQHDYFGLHNLRIKKRDELVRQMLKQFKGNHSMTLDEIAQEDREHLLENVQRLLDQDNDDTFDYDPIEQLRNKDTIIFGTVSGICLLLSILMVTWCTLTLSRRRQKTIEQIRQNMRSKRRGEHKSEKKPFKPMTKYSHSASISL